MKGPFLCLRNLKSYVLIFLGIHLSLFLQGKAQEDNTHFSSKPLHEVATLGAPTTGAMVEGLVGAIHKGGRHRFYCHSTGPQLGFIGPQTTVKPLSIKDQPGVFPAPLMGPASLTFIFSCQHPHASFTPLIVKPDGTIFQGLPLTIMNSPQTLEISAPAQTGIYTLFILNHPKFPDVQVAVEAIISTQPQQSQTFHLKSFEPNGSDAELISAEFIYTPHP